MNIKTNQIKKNIPKVTKSRVKRKPLDTKDKMFNEMIYGNVWIRQIHLKKAGAFKKGHIHNFDHIHVVVKGSVEIFELQDTDKGIKRVSLGEYTAPNQIKVPKGVAHTIVAVDDDYIGMCIQAVRDNDNEVMETSYIDDDTDAESTVL